MSTGGVTSNSNSASGASSSAASNAANPLGSLSPTDFLNLMIQELKNQDPTSPMDPSTIMQQLADMQSITATTGLTTSLNSVALEQSISSASLLIGSTVAGLDASGNKVSGNVDSVSMVNGAPQLNIGSSALSLSNITSITPTGAAGASGS
jgi:flagellar basal-body rod modification protein FlgD